MPFPGEIVLPSHVYDYMDANWKSVPQDVISLTKLIQQEGWTDEVTVSLLQQWCQQRREDTVVLDFDPADVDRNLRENAPAAWHAKQQK